MKDHKFSKNTDSRKFVCKLFEALQSWILYQSKHNDTYRQNYSDMQDELYLSMMFALFHTIIEGIIIYLESRALKISVLHYTVLCMNGRFGWVPYTSLM